ncbi:MAG: fatty acid desaturase, partial [Paracoccaceae bacterium]
MPRDSQGFEWPTVFVLLATYVVWLAGITVLAQLWLPLGIVAVALASAQHASISHEVLHGHPFRNRHLNAALVFPAVSLVVPYMRFRDTHLAHHRDSR